MKDIHSEDPHGKDDPSEETRCSEQSLINDARYARIDAYNDVQIGVCIYLSVIDLRELGIDLSQSTEMVEYTIEDETRRLIIRPDNR